MMMMWEQSGNSSHAAVLHTFKRINIHAQYSALMQVEQRRTVIFLKVGVGGGVASQLALPLALCF